MRNLIDQLTSYYRDVSTALDFLQPVALLSARFYVAWVFFASGLTKIQNWDSTLFLFEEEYMVPLLSPELAAYLSTAGELILPVLLALGLMGRFAAIGLSVVNVVAVISLEEIAPAAHTMHVLWGLLLAQVVVWGAGFFSADSVLHRRWSISSTSGSNIGTVK